MSSLRNIEDVLSKINANSFYKQKLFTFGSDNKWKVEDLFDVFKMTYTFCDRFFQTFHASIPACRIELNWQCNFKSSSGNG